MAQRKLADFISTNLAYTINTFFTNPKSFFCFIFPLQSSHYICCIHLLNQMYFPIASQCHSINYSTRRGLMEYYSIRVKWSAWTSNPLGVCTPLTVDKKKSVFAPTMKYKDSCSWDLFVCTAGTDLRWWHKRVQCGRLLKAISRLHLQLKLQLSHYIHLHCHWSHLLEFPDRKKVRLMPRRRKRIIKYKFTGNSARK